MIAYLDSSALVKLVADEPESRALVAELSRWPERTSSVLARVEVARVARLLGPVALEAALAVLDALDLIRIEAELLEVAARLDPPHLCSLHAIHVASALTLGDALGALITYDVRMLTAARGAGVPVVTPS